MGKSTTSSISIYRNSRYFDILIESPHKMCTFPFFSFFLGRHFSSPDQLRTSFTLSELLENTTIVMLQVSFLSSPPVRVFIFIAHRVPHYCHFFQFFFLYARRLSLNSAVNNSLALSRFPLANSYARKNPYEHNYVLGGARIHDLINVSRDDIHLLLLLLLLRWRLRPAAAVRQLIAHMHVILTQFDASRRGKKGMTEIFSSR